MKLWTQWLRAVCALRPACRRARTFVWTVLVLVGLCCRADNAGVTSFVRVLNFSGQAYHRFLHLFHSTSLDLDVLTSCWVRLCLVLFRPFEVDSRLVCLADGIKAPKEGRRMPGVKYLHQHSASNTKPEYIMGHSLQAISLLVHCGGGQVAAVPLTSRIHEGLVFSNRDARTLLDKLVALLFSIARAGDRKVLLVADAYYASGKVITPLLANGHQLLTRAKSNAVAYLPVPQPARRGKGRPKIYGNKVRLKDLAQDDSAFICAPSPVYGERDVTVRYRVLDLMGRPVGRIVRFCIVHHPVRATIFLLSTDTTLQPLQMLELYGYRFKIELGFSTSRSCHRCVCLSLLDGRHETSATRQWQSVPAQNLRHLSPSRATKAARLPRSRSTRMHRSGAIAAPVNQSHGRGLALLSQLAAHHESGNAAI